MCQVCQPVLYNNNNAMEVHRHGINTLMRNLHVNQLIPMQQVGEREPTQTSHLLYIPVVNNALLTVTYSFAYKRLTGFWKNYWTVNKVSERR